MRVWIAEFPWWRLSLQLHPAEICGMAGIARVVLRITHFTPHLAVYFSMLLCSSYICVWNIAMWQHKSRHSCSHVEDPHRIYKSDHMKQYPKKVLVDICSQNRKNVKCHCQHVEIPWSNSRNWSCPLPSQLETSSSVIRDGFNMVQLQFMGVFHWPRLALVTLLVFLWGGPPATISHSFFLQDICGWQIREAVRSSFLSRQAPKCHENCWHIELWGMQRCIKDLRLVSSEGHSSGIRTGHIGGSVTQAFLAAWTTKCGPENVTRKEHNLETLRPCFLRELMEKEKCYILTSYNMGEKNAEAN